MTVSTSGEASVSSSGAPPPIQPSLTAKKKRNLPGMPDPNAEVIALSPKTLMATNRFVCEICNKGFQRDQNLQLHRRGHNLPWKLRQRTNKEIRKRVYVCPETSCVHHDPSRALGDLTGIKKHFCRKHGEKKWKCDKCSKKYAVQSDWKAHLKTCGTKEYKCDCGTLFSRRDSFITHRAFCDALAEENAKAQTTTTTNSKSSEEQNNQIQNEKQVVVGSSCSSPPSTSAISAIQTTELPLNSTTIANNNNSSCRNENSPSVNFSSNSNSMFTSLYPSSVALPGNLQPPQTTSFSDLICGMGGGRSERSSTSATEQPTSLSLSSKNGSSMFASTMTSNQESHQFSSPQPAMSATALLQKAAQMGAAATSASLLRGLGFSVSGSSSSQQQQQTENLQWDTSGSNNLHQHQIDNHGGAGLSDGLGVPSSLFGRKPATLDFLGLGMDRGGGGSSFSSLMNSVDANLNIANAAGPFRDVNSGNTAK
ncbi:protein indeterminate-domain 2-like isoform X1 [Papaver somniferum]|uniref:protein indeterminate-domain 2-like isoform X1 n=1 Tax=Papaver somniferum TaxID=3469 RepID=UPI000E7058CE|nr:protein indeterminate-domain 2-like isoform X1 [Papaver somniferum]